MGRPIIKLLAVFAPAFPDVGRTTYARIHYVNDVPVRETAYEADDRGPSSTALGAPFEGNRRPVRTVTEEDADAGSGRVAAAFAAAVEKSGRAPVVACDGRSSDDLAVSAATRRY